MVSTLYSASIYPEIIAHTSLNLMTKITDYDLIGEDTKTEKEQDEALRRAWISNTEVSILERKRK